MNEMKKTRCIFCGRYIEAHPLVVLLHVTGDCPDHALRLWERLVRDMAKTLVDRRVDDAAKLTLLLEQAMAAMMCAEDHLGKAMLKAQDRDLERELVNAMAQIVLAHKVCSALHPQGRG